MVFILEIIWLKNKGWAYVKNLDEYTDAGTHWIASYCKRNEINYFDSFGGEHVPVEVKEFIPNKIIIANIFRVQANNSIMCGYFCIGFIYFMLAGKKTDWFYKFFFSSKKKKKWQHNFELF